MKTEIIAVGSELLSPDFLETNSLFLVELLNGLGIPVAYKTVVGDDEDTLLDAVRTALRRSRLILAIGGLGPTEDDRTREVFARALGLKLVYRREIFEGIKARFARRGLSVPATNKKQAYVIEGAEILDNPNGTAPGLWLAGGRRRIALLPGPPRELKPMAEAHLRPRLAALGSGRMIRRTVRLTGIGESLMESRLRDVYRNLPEGMDITTLASPGDLAIRLTQRTAAEADTAEDDLDAVQAMILRRFGPLVYSFRGEDLETVIGSMLKERRESVSCAESCSGGLLGHRLTNVPGSSAYFLESVVAYGNRSKIRRLGVPSALLQKHGAVSAPAARFMAEGIRRRSGSDYGLSITGIAGPDGGSPRKPVGLVYIALARARGTAVRRNLFFGGRENVKFQSSQKALDLLRHHLTKKGKKG